MTAAGGLDRALSVIAVLLVAAAVGFGVATVVRHDTSSDQREARGGEGGDPSIPIPRGLPPNLDPREECRKGTALAQDELRQVCDALGF